MGPFDTPIPFGGNLLPPGATGGEIIFGPGGWRHVTIRTEGAHVSYDIRGNEVRNVHATIHDVTGGGQHIIVEPRR
jgi:hypothetical protein